MSIFDGMAYALERETKVRERVAELHQKLRILSVVFGEDPSSQLYTQLKCEAAARVGMDFDRLDVSMLDDFEFLRHQVRSASMRADVDGILVQKPAKATWVETVHQHPGRMEDFRAWWLGIVSELLPAKDIDCLTEENLRKVYEGSWTILPATVTAILRILSIGLELPMDLTLPGDGAPLNGLKAVVLGTSRIVGHPLSGVLVHHGADVVNVGSTTSDLQAVTCDADILVSATGRRGLISGEMVKKDAIVIDVGSPVGDVVFESVSKKARFITPSPNGVGPVTVVSLLENMLSIA